MTWVDDRFGATMMAKVCKLLIGLLVASMPVMLPAAESEVPMLMPGTKMPFKLWETEKLADGVYAFRYSFYRNVFIVTDNGVIATDPLSPEAAPIMREEIRKITDQPVRFVAYTHSHWDHAAGGQVFKDEGATFVAQAGCAANLVENPNPAVIKPDITFDDYHEIKLGDQSLEMFFFGPSHDNCLAVMLINPANLLFLVDIANPPDGWAMFYNPSISEDRPWHMVRFFTQLQSLVEERGIETVIGGHMAGSFDPVTNRPMIVKGTTGPATVVKQKLEFWTAIIETAKAELAAGTSPEDVPDIVVEKGLLADRISGYDPEKMRILMRRMTSLAITGE
jgi:glyoxylase-like metal-dependent hydrolase (beta-lactamase superfamily II)